MTENQKQIEYWNGSVGKQWQIYHDVIDDMLSEFTKAMVAKVGDCKGLNLLDIGCGAGETTYILAETAEHVDGLDVSQQLLDDAINRKDFENKGNIDFRICDVSTFDFTPETYDIAVSRFGLMFFDDSIKSFKNFGKSLKKGGRLVFVAWQAPKENEWIQITMDALKGIAEAVSANNPDKPGPFAFHNPQKIQNILENSGYGNIEIEDLECDLVYNRNKGLKEGVKLLSIIGPGSRSLAKVSPELHDEGMKRLTAACESHMIDNSLTFKGKVWLVSAVYQG